MLYIFLALGGAVGTLARYGITGGMLAWLGSGFPWGTFAVNMIGSFALGLAIQGSETAALTPELRAMLTIGFCGAFTTFSTFSLETITLIQHGAWGRASLYTFGSLGLGLVFLVLGVLAAGVLIRPTG